MGDKGIGISDYQVAGEQKIRVSGGRGRGSGGRRAENQGIRGQGSGVRG